MPDDLYFSDDDAGLQSTIRGLFGTPTTPLPFLDGVVVRAFLLERPEGNVIVYNSPGIDRVADRIRGLGRVDRLLLNHEHESMYGDPDLDVPVHVHERDRAATGMRIAGTFRGRHTLGDDLEIIPIPGHTPGTTAFLWDSGEHRLLFPGDSIWVQGGRWKAVLLRDGDRAAYIESLESLREVEFDVLVPWGVEDGEPYGYAVSPDRAKRNLDRIVARLRAGENA